MKPKENDIKVYLTWDQVDTCINRIIRDIKKSDHEINAVYGVDRGGNIPATIIAYKLGVPFEILGKNEKYYNTEDPVWEWEFENALIIDDVCDNGNTFNSIMDYLKAHHAGDNILTAALYVKPWATFNVDFIGASSEDWVCFPWETEEFDREWNNG